MSIQIQKVTDKSFRKYGRILTGEYDVAELMDAMEKQSVRMMPLFTFLRIKKLRNCQS